MVIQFATPATDSIERYIGKNNQWRTTSVLLPFINS